MRLFTFIGLAFLCATFAVRLGAEPSASADVLRNKLAKLQEKEREEELFAAATLLTDEKKSNNERLDAIRRLALLQDISSIPVLRTVLNDTVLGDEARMALQIIPGPVTTVALLAALKNETDPRLKAGLLVSLGELRSETMIPLALLNTASSDTALAEASLHALGQIQTAASLKALTTATIQPAHKKLRQQLLLNPCDALFVQPNSGASRSTVIEALKKISDDKEFPRIRLAALVLLIQFGHLHVEDCLKSEDEATRAAALFFLQHSRDIDSEKILLTQFQTAQGEALVPLLAALAERQETSMVPSIRTLAKTIQNANVRAAALRALSTLGSDADISFFAAYMSAPEESVAAAAKDALFIVRGENVGDEFSRLIAGNEINAAIRRELIGIVQRRPIYDAMPGLISALADTDKGVREEAVKALGRLVVIDDLAKLKAVVPLISDTVIRKRLEQICEKLEKDAGG